MDGSSVYEGAVGTALRGPSVLERAWTWRSKRISARYSDETACSDTIKGLLLVLVSWPNGPVVCLLVAKRS
jgi:hypothetical protein